MTKGLPRLGLAICLSAGLAALGGCSLVTKGVANSLSKPSDVYTRDNDPELVRDAIPFGLKTYESLLESVPNHVGLLTATCSGFTSYAFAFVQSDADLIRATDHPQAQALDDRALNLYMRGHDYCLRALEVRFKGVTKRLMDDPDTALDKTGKKDDVMLLYWSAASWGGAISLGIDRPDLVIDFPAVRALANRALSLDPDWNHGAHHELMITLDSVPEALGGSPDKARADFKRAVELQQGNDAGPYVSLALGVSLPAGNRAEFDDLLAKALAVDVEKDPSNRLVNIINQRRAKALVAQADALFGKHLHPMEAR